MCRSGIGITPRLQVLPLLKELTVGGMFTFPPLMKLIVF